MSKKRGEATGVLLDLWRPPQGAGEPVGCLATTYTFEPGLFDEQCLARFLEIESEPNREDLAFLLERENRLGGVYAGVLVDYTQSGVEHSLRWDVLPVRIPLGKQHAKLSLLVWTSHIRVVVTSANLTEQGYRTNHEVAAAIDMTPTAVPAETMEESLTFLRSLSRFVPVGDAPTPALLRAAQFLDQVQEQVRPWKAVRGRTSIRRHLVFTLPGDGSGSAARSTLDEAIHLCRARGGSPQEARVASPFFDEDSGTSLVTGALCKAMARGGRRALRLSLPGVQDKAAGVARLDAPRSLLTTAKRYVNAEDISVELLPAIDADKNLRIWHAKMLGLKAEQYSAVMIGSSNFTSAGMGVTSRKNAEANLLTIVDHVYFAREPNRLEAVWPAMEPIVEPESAEWLGPRPEREEEEQAATPPPPPGFLAAIYRAGDHRLIILQLEPDQLPQAWQVHASGLDVMTQKSSTICAARTS